MSGPGPEAVRRLDWRFLLPDPALGRVAFALPGDDGLHRALREVSGTLLAGTPRQLRAQPAADLTVLSGTSPELLAEAAALVPAGGWLYLELPKRAAMRGLVRRSRGTLAAAGFDTVRPHWHWPSFEAGRRIVPLDHPMGARAPLRSQLGRPLRGIEPVVEALLSVGRGVELVGGRVSLLARRGGGTTPDWLCLEPIADELRHALAADAPSWAMLTPRFRASEHVLLLLAARERDAPRLVAKVARRVGVVAALEREAANLRRLTAGPVPKESVPRLVTTGETRSGHRLLVESGLAGLPLDPATVRQRPRGWVSLVTEWLGALPLAHEGSVEPLAEMLADPLREFAQRVPGPDGANRQLVADTLAALEPLPPRLPRPFEHGDLGHPNLLVDDGSLRVLDWEAGRADGLPLHDLVFFLGYVAKAVGRVGPAGDHPAAFTRLLADPSSGAAEALRAEAVRLGVAPTLIGPLVLACWARTVAGLAARATGAPAELDDWLRTNRYYLLWRDALRRQEDLGRELR
jgi:hypothetical protein